MSKKTIYTCDRCGADQETRNQFWALRVQVKHFDNPLDWDPAYSEMEVCRSCLEHLGIHPSPATKASPDYNPPSTEELIREILSRVGVQGLRRTFDDAIDAAMEGEK